MVKEVLERRVYPFFGRVLVISELRSQDDLAKLRILIDRVVLGVFFLYYVTLYVIDNIYL